jgi:hypothetical protein
MSDTKEDQNQETEKVQTVVDDNGLNSKTINVFFVFLF